MRLDKVLEQQQVGSRKAVRRLFQRGLVCVNNQIVREEGFNVEPALHTVVVAGKQLDFTGHAYFMLNKPQGVVTAVKDSEHTTVIDLIRAEERTPKLYPVGRLDRDTEGLLLITDNGQLGYELMHPEKKVVKRYEVVVNGALDEVDYQRFAEGITFIGGEQCQEAELTILTSSPEESHAYLDIKEGKFHQVKKMFLSVGKKVVFLKRLSMGPLSLTTELAPGMYRRLNASELKLLMPYFETKNRDE
ncbi:16S rRNA pseudouridine(516) synthase [uncultured Enterococcus sp.]|uniref:pseudouridine synthase n=1 Tax=uncultured Enterococcus sp. TaxID=167972 RepID=UPI002AA81C9E|nr:16S rRNA pseudouridine(516) synthase [uncultured Enterococcus sp.]